MGALAGAEEMRELRIQSCEEWNVVMIERTVGESGAGSEEAAEDSVRFPAQPQDLLNFLGRAVANQQVNAVLRLDGSLDEDRMRRAMRLAIEAQPVLGCRFAESPDRPHWVRRDDRADLDLCSVLPDGGTDAELWRFIASPTDPRRDALVRAAVLRGHSDTLCIKMDHTAADAAGARQFVALLAEIYGSLGSGTGAAVAPDAQIDRGLAQVLRGFTPETLARLGGQFRGGGAPAFGWPRAAAPAPDAVEFSIRRLEPQRVRALRTWGRSRGATLNDMLLAAFYRGLIELFDPPTGQPLPVQVPVDLRRYLPGRAAGAVCNLSSAVWPAVRRETTATFEDAVAAVIDAMAPLKADDPGIGAALFVDRVFGLPFSQAVAAATSNMGVGGDRSHPYLSNLGEVILGEADAAGAQHFGDLRVGDAFLVSPALYPPGFMVGVSTFRETLTLTVGHPGATDTASLVSRLLDSMARDLERLH